MAARRIVHVIGTLEMGGGSTHLLLLLPRLAPCGFESLVIAGRNGPAGDRLRAVGIPVSTVGAMGLTAPLRLAPAISSLRPDVVHLHGSRAGFAGAVAARLVRIRPVVYTAHAFAFKRRLPRLLRGAAVRVERMTCGSADAVICLTREDAKTAARVGIAMRQCAVIPNGIDPAPFAAAGDRRAEFGIGLNVPVVGTVGRLVPGKDPLTFVRMAAEINRRLPEVRYLVAGDGPFKAHVEQAVSTMGLGDRLIVTGLRDDIPAVLATMDVFVLPSLWEALPLSLLEAMASGRPVVCSNLPTLAEVVRDAGLLVPPGDASGFAQAVLALVADPDRRSRMGRAGQEHVAREHTVERMIEGTAAVYDSILVHRGV